MPSTPSQDTNAPKPYIGVGDVVQITPSADRFYAGCLLVVKHCQPCLSLRSRPRENVVNTEDEGKPLPLGSGR